MSREKTVAFIDIGTNSARLLVVSIEGNGAYHTLTRIKDVVRLGEGELPPDAFRTMQSNG